MNQRLGLCKIEKQSALLLMLFSLTAYKFQHPFPQSWDLMMASPCLISAQAVVSNLSQLQSPEGTLKTIPDLHPDLLNQNYWGKAQELAFAVFLRWFSVA